MKIEEIKGLSGVIVTKSSPNYIESCTSWNRGIEKQPSAIVFCETIKDVQLCIKYCHEYNILFKVRSGRHHYAGLSTGDDVVVIDVSLINQIAVDEVNQIVTVQGGVRNRELYEALGAKGYPFPGGGCPTVGVAGFTLGGGWGYSSRLFGLGCDNLIEVKLIDYKGDEIIANATQNSDLFWALRGCGGQNFGIVVEHTYALPQKLNQGSLINVDFMHCEKDSMKAIVKAYQELFKQLDHRMNMKLGIYNSSQKGYGIRITGLFYGNRDEALKILSPIIQFVKDDTIFAIDEMSILEANRDIQDSHPDYENYKSAGRFLYKDLTDEDLNLILEIIEERAIGAYYTAVSLYGLGGAVAKKTNQETAFNYRDAAFILGFQSVWDNNEVARANNEWFLPRYKQLQALTKGTFINFPLLELENYMDEYYGENKSKLIEIKQKYDPLNIFDFEQAIK